MTCCCQIHLMEAERSDPGESKTSKAEGYEDL